MEWFIYYMISHPEIQEKVHTEIDSVLGARNASLADKGTMPYTEAVIEEASRITPLASLVIPHLATKDTRVGNYFYPKGTPVRLSLVA